MKKLISEVFRLPSGSLIPQLYCLDDAGQPSRSVTETLLDLISEASPPADSELERLVSEAELGRYVATDPDLPDWSCNDKYVWLRPPMAEPGCICVSNENSAEFSQEEGEPQQFTIQQFRLALDHWRKFRELIRQRGIEALAEQRFEREAW